MLKKIILTLSLLAFAIGFSNFGEASQWGVSLPLGAVFFILFMIVTLLEKETALYDVEEHQKAGNAPVAVSTNIVPRGICQVS